MFDLLDTSLATDLVHSQQLTNDIVERFKTLGRYARNTSGVGGGTKGILFTCSAFGPAIEAVKREMDVPTLRPNESAFREALDGGQRIAVVVSFPLRSIRSWLNSSRKRVFQTKRFPSRARSRKARLPPSRPATANGMIGLSPNRPAA